MDLLTAIRQNSQQATQNQGVTDETQKAQNLLAARSGKALPQSGLKTTTNLGEQQAVAQTNQQLGQLAQSAEVQNQGLAQDQEATQNQFNQQSQALDQQRQGIQLKNQQQTREILNNLRRAKGDIDQKQYEAQMEQAGQDVRLTTKRYVDDLQREGARSRLNDELSFKEALAKSQFGDSSELLKKQLGNKSILDASEREFDEALSQMGIDTAYSTLKQEIAAQREGMFWSGIGGAAKGGIGAYEKYDESQARDAENARKKEYYTGAGQQERSYDAWKWRNS